jgi:hypothetical protein
MEKVITRRNGDSFTIIVDDGFNWTRKISITSKGYASIKINSKSVLLHRFIIGAKQGEEVDHINRNPLDNRRSNLRICTRMENTQNRRAKGYFYCKRDKKYISKLNVNKKTIYLGRFDNPEEAREAYLKGKIKYHGNPCEY